MIEISLTDLLSFIVKVKKEANTVIISVNQNMSSMTSKHNKSKFCLRFVIGTHI